ncbi:MAG: carboxypeptidase-like regulatory domain-containing protein, partial [Acidobacteriota bacterium]
MYLAPRRAVLALWAVVLISASQYGVASSLGSFSGRIQDPSGKPLSNILVALLYTSPEPTPLPILTRSDEAGEIRLSNLEAGNYELLVKNSQYRSRNRNLVQVLPGKTTVLSLVLQQLFGEGSFDEENQEVKTVLRNAGDDRLIFRYLPETTGQDSDSSPLAASLGEAVVQVYGNGSSRGSYPVGAGAGSGGATTHFALVQSLGTSSKYIVAGQLSSGVEELWRLRNSIELPLSDSHTFGVFVGYGRENFAQSGLAPYGNPTTLGHHLDDAPTIGSTRVLSVGIQEKLLLGNVLSILWGLELNQVTANQRQTFLNPNAELSYSPTEQTKFKVMMASKRMTHSGSLLLPDGERLNLREAVYFSRVGNQLAVSTPRHYRGSITQQLTKNTEIELAAYENQLFGETTPLLAYSKEGPTRPGFRLADEHAVNRGYRVMVRRRLGNTLNTALSYIHGKASGISRDATLVFDEFALDQVIERRNFHTLNAEIEVYIPFSGTRLNALVKFASNGHPITTLDAFADTYETGNEGVNLFVRQVVPVPGGWLAFLGMDFLSSYEIEALLDIRNLTNEALGKVRTEIGDVSLVRNPRTVRGGISVR